MTDYQNKATSMRILTKAELATVSGGIGPIAAIVVRVVAGAILLGIKGCIDSQNNKNNHSNPACPDKS